MRAEQLEPFDLGVLNDVYLRFTDAKTNRYRTFEAMITDYVVLKNAIANRLAARSHDIRCVTIAAEMRDKLRYARGIHMSRAFIVKEI